MNMHHDSTHDFSYNILVMNYQSVNMPMPPLHAHAVKLAFRTEEEQEVYDYVRDRLAEVLKKFLRKLVDYNCVLTWFLYLRLAAIAPYTLLSPKEHTESRAEMQLFVGKLAPDAELYKYICNKQGTGGIYSTKMQKTIDIIKQCKREKPHAKVLVFSMFVRTLTLLADAIDTCQPSWRHEMMIGDTTFGERQTVLQTFRRAASTSVGGTIDILLMHYKIGGEGLNLTEASHVLFLEPWWNDAVHSQARSRAWRMGQKSPVHVHFLYMKDTVEDRIFELCQHKLLEAKRIIPDLDTKNMESVYNLADSINGTNAAPAGGKNKSASGITVELLKSFLN